MKKSISFLFALTLMLLFPHGARGQQSTTLVNQDKIIARVQAMGDGASVDQVMSEACKATGANYYERIQLIAKINTAPARQALLEVALGKGEGERTIAADAYVRVLPDKRSATNLFQSTDRMVLFSALSGLQGCKVDDDLWRHLKPLLASQDVGVRFSVFVVLNSSPSPVPENMIKAVVDSLAGLDQMHDATNVIWVQTASELNYQDSKSSKAYARFVGLLGRCKDASKEMLAKWTPAEAGNFRDAMLVASALKKDDSLKPELQRIVRESSLPSLRVEALRAFANLATIDDLPFLQGVAAKDAWLVVPRGAFINKLETFNLPTDAYYPLRKMAQEVTWKLAPTHFGRPTPGEGGYPNAF